MAYSKNWAQRIADRTDLPGENIQNLPLIEIVGKCRVLIEHHCGVVEYGSERIVIQVKKGRVTVIGMCLTLANMTAQQLIITGKICALELEG